MKRSGGFLALAIATLAVLVSQAEAQTSVEAAGPVKTSVTLEVWPGEGVFGFVGSVAKCGKGRVVVVSREGSDGWNRIGAVKASKSGTSRGSFQWQLKTSRVIGRLRARVPGSSRCRAAFAIRKLLPDSGDHPASCPDADGAHTRPCRFEELNLNLGACTAFSAGVGSCDGEADSGVWPWSPARAEVWWRDDRGPERTLTYISTGTGGNRARSELRGTLSSSDSPALRASVDISYTFPNSCYLTADLGEPPGEPGGPLYLNWVNVKWPFNAHAYIRGYLYPNPSPKSDYCHP